MAEKERLEMIEHKSGVHAAVEFAQRTMGLYRTCVLRSRKRGFDKPHHASIPEYRRGFIESYLAFKHYIKAHNVKLTVCPTTKGEAEK